MLAKLTGVLSFHDQKQLSGTIPTELYGLNVARLGLHDVAKLSGTLPPVMGTWTGAGALYLAGTQLSGTLPTEVGRLILSSAGLNMGETPKLSGTLPTEVGLLVSLGSNPTAMAAFPLGAGQFVWRAGRYASDAKLSGTLPSEARALNHVAYETTSSPPPKRRLGAHRRE